VCLAAACAILELAGACGGEVSHDEIDKWRTTKKGPAKLKEVVAATARDADLRAHAAQNLIAMGAWADVKDALEADPKQRGEVVAKLAPRLQQSATVPEGYAPAAQHAAAKDALFRIRAYADEQTRGAIDEYLADWLAVSYYDRAGRGTVAGATILKTIGKVAAPKLLTEARSVIAAVADEQGRVRMLSDDLLLGLAYTADSAAVAMLIDMAAQPHEDETLQRRAMGALYVAYIEDLEEPRPNPTALKPQVARLAQLARDRDQLPSNINAAFDLMAAAGPPECVAPMVSLVDEKRAEEAFLWLAVQKGLLCVGAAEADKIVEVIPPRAYERAILEKYLWNKMKTLEPTAVLADSCRRMLGSINWVARVTAVEILAEIGQKSDAASVHALATDKTQLKDWWGDAKRPSPTVSAIAQEVAKKLENR
jgi:hypothetical protein